MHPNLSFGAPGASTLASWGRWDDPGARRLVTGEHKKGHFGLQALVFIDWGLIRGLHAESVSGTLDQQMLVSRFVFQRVCGLNLDVWGSKSVVWYQKFCENQLFAEIGILLISVSFFSDLL